MPVWPIILGVDSCLVCAAVAHGLQVRGHVARERPGNVGERGKSDCLLGPEKKWPLVPFVSPLVRHHGHGHAPLK